MHSLVSVHLKAASSTLLRHSSDHLQIRLPRLGACIIQGQANQLIIPAAMSSDAVQSQILAAFKTADDQSAFTASFKLVSSLTLASACELLAIDATTTWSGTRQHQHDMTCTASCLNS